MIYLENHFKARNKKRFKAGVSTLLEIRKFQKSTYLILNKIPFYKLIKEITKQFTNKKFLWTTNTVFLLREILEHFLVNILSDCNVCAGHANRVTVMVRDLLLANRIKDLNNK